VNFHLHLPIKRGKGGGKKGGEEATITVFCKGKGKVAEVNSFAKGGERRGGKKFQQLNIKQIEGGGKN